MNKPPVSRVMLNLSIAVVVATSLGCEGTAPPMPISQPPFVSASVTQSRVGLRDIINRGMDDGKRAEIGYRRQLATLVSDREYLALLNKHLDDSAFVIMKVSDTAVANIISSIYRERSLDRKATLLQESRAWARSHPVGIAIGFSTLELGENRALIARTPRLPGQVIVVLAPNAEAMDIAIAYRTLFELRDLEGDLIDRDEKVMVHPGQMPVPAKRLAEYRELITRLKAAGPMEIAGFRFSSAITTRLGHLRAPPGVLSRRNTSGR